MTVPPVPHRSGRPKDPAKRAAILTAARTLFASQPFELVTMETVAGHARVSKMTVYSHFQDKETLFEASIVATVNGMINALPAAEQGGGLRERLIAVGEAFLSVILGSDICRLSHTLPGTLSAHPGLAERFYAAGPERVRAALAAMIAAAAEREELTVDHADKAADDLVSLWEGSQRAKIAFGLATPSTPEEISQRAVRGTDVFLRAYRSIR